MTHVRDVGIVMPVYKQDPEYLKLAIRSILNQTFKYFKLVIVLDGSPKDIVQLVHQEVASDRRVRVVAHHRNKGVAAALNRGFRSLYRRKHIRYLTWVSSDNIYYPNFLRELRRKLRRSKSKVGLSYSSFHHVDSRGNQIFGQDFHEEFRSWQNKPRESLLDICFIGASFMYKRRYAERTGPYTMEPVEDYDYWLRLTEHCEIAYVPAELMAYRTESPYSISRSLASPEQHRRWRNAYQLTKLQARGRRGIPPAATVIVPIHAISETVAPNLEALFEQPDSNRDIVVVDTTANGEMANLLAVIPDPRVRLIHLPGASQEQAVQIGQVSAVAPATVYYL